MTLTARVYQQEAIWLAERSNVLIADECGLGKTLDAIEIGRLLAAGPKLVVCNKSAKEQWREAIIAQYPDSVVFVLGDAGIEPVDFRWSMIKPPSTLNCWVVTHYASVSRIYTELTDREWVLLVLDESHRIKNRKAQQTVFIKRIQAKRKVALTGTPYDKRIDELWSQINWLYPKGYSEGEYPDDDKLFRSYWAFKDEFVDEVRHPYLGYPEYKGSKNLDRLSALIGPFFLRRTKDEVAPELPPKIKTRVPLRLEGQQKRLYDTIAAAKDIEVPMSEVTGIPQDILVIKNVISKILRLQQITSDPRNMHYEVDSAKVDWVRDYVVDNPNEPLLVLTKFRETAQRIAALLDADLLIGGMTNPSTRIVNWLTGKRQALVGTIATMGESLNLQRARTLIFVDQEWSTIKMKQAEDRIHRMDITEPKNIIYLYAAETVDDLVLEALDKKWSDAELAYHYLKAYGSGV